MAYETTFADEREVQCKENEGNGKPTNEVIPSDSIPIKDYPRRLVQMIAIESAKLDSHERVKYNSRRLRGQLQSSAMNYCRSWLRGKGASVW